MEAFTKFLIFILTFLINVLLYNFVFAGLNIFLTCIILIVIDILIWMVADALANWLCDGL